MSLERAHRALQPQLGGHDAGAVGDDGDPPVAVLDEVTDRGLGPAEVVDRHGVDVDALRGAIHDDDGEAGAHLAHEVVLPGRGGGDDEAVDAPAHKSADDLLLPLRGLVETRREK